MAVIIRDLAITDDSTVSNWKSKIWVEFDSCFEGDMDIAVLAHMYMAIWPCTLCYIMLWYSVDK